MQAILAEFVKRLSKFEARALELSLLSLRDIEHDNDARAAMTMLVSGALELFLREVTRDYVSVVCARGAPFNALPKPMRRCHYEEGAHYLLIAAREDWLEVAAGRASTFIAAADVCRRLHSVSGACYELVWEGFARMDSNADSATIKKMLNRLDVDAPWEAIEANIPVGLHPLPAGPGRVNKIIADVGSLRDARNRCAHGSTAAPPAWSVLLEYIVALRALAAGIVAALQARLQRMPS